MPLSAVEPCSHGGSDGKIVQSASGNITTKHYTSGFFFPVILCIFLVVFSITHWPRMQQKSSRSNFCHRAWSRTASQAADFNLYLKRSSTRAEVNRGRRSNQSSAGKEGDYNHCCVFYQSLPGRKWIMKVNIFKEKAEFQREIHLDLFGTSVCLNFQMLCPALNQVQ